MTFDILFEDQDILAIAKPPGVVVNTAGTVSEATVQEWMMQRLSSTSQLTPKAEWQPLVPDTFDNQYGTPEEIFAERGGIVHRLDKDTSGVLILAKNPGALVHLLSQFQQRTVSKRYTCLVHGKFRAPEGIIQAPMERASYDRQKFAVSATGRVAETHYKVVQTFKGVSLPTLESLFEQEQEISFREFGKRCTQLYQGFSLVHCWPKTGRTHQIRVHLRHWGHPIVGDDKYVGKKRVKLDQMWMPRQFLHASELMVTHPRTQEQLHLEAPLSTDLEKTLGFLE
jgi:23S rRNA pseudouridine1911/1915/1917 synthase